MYQYFIDIKNNFHEAIIKSFRGPVYFETQFNSSSKSGSSITGSSSVI